MVQCYNGEISFNVDMYDNNDGSYETFIAVPKDGFYDVSLKLMFSLCEALKDPERLSVVLEAVVQRYSVKKVFLKISQISQEIKF